MIKETTKVPSTLIIDDDFFVNKLNTIILESTNRIENIIAVESAVLGIEQLDKFYSKKDWPSLLFIDINMPAMNGWELVDAIKERFGVANKKGLIIVLSSSADPRDENKAVESEMVDTYLLKPLTESAILNLCDVFLTKYNE